MSSLGDFFNNDTEEVNEEVDKQGEAGAMSVDSFSLIISDEDIANIINVEKLGKKK